MVFDKNEKALFVIYLLINFLLVGLKSVQGDQETLREKIVQAERYVAEGEIDFAFMEYRALLEAYPKDPLAREAAFAIGEYHFDQHNTREAKRAFEMFNQEAAEEIPRLLVQVYLLLCARLLKDDSSVQAFESHLKEMLSSKKLFLAFEENRIQEWTSPLGNRFSLREFVDHMEITLNGAPFYSISLP